MPHLLAQGPFDLNFLANHKSDLPPGSVMALRAMRIRKVETRHTYVRRIHCLEARPFGGLLPDLTTYGFVGPVVWELAPPGGCSQTSSYDNFNSP